MIHRYHHMEGDAQKLQTRFPLNELSSLSSLILSVISRKHKQSSEAPCTIQTSDDLHHQKNLVDLVQLPLFSDIMYALMWQERWLWICKHNHDPPGMLASKKRINLPTMVASNHATASRSPSLKGAIDVANVWVLSTRQIWNPSCRSKRTRINMHVRPSLERSRVYICTLHWRADRLPMHNAHAPGVNHSHDWAVHIRPSSSAHGNNSPSGLGLHLPPDPALPLDRDLWCGASGCRILFNGLSDEAQASDRDCSCKWFYYLQTALTYKVFSYPALMLFIPRLMLHPAEVFLSDSIRYKQKGGCKTT